MNPNELKQYPAFREILGYLRDKRTFQLVSHKNPDGDAIGSLMALGKILKTLDKQVQIFLNAEDVSDAYQFILSEEITAEIPEEPAEVFIPLECPTLDRIGKWQKLAKKAPLVLGIDHHPDNRLYAHVNLVVPQAASTTQILYYMARELGVDVTIDLAVPLYVGLVTDTGKFQYSNTNAESLKVASELASLGVVPNEIFEAVYEQESPKMPVIMGRFMSRVQFMEEQGIIYSTITRKDLEETDSEMKDTENFIDMIRAVKGVRVAALFKEEEQEGIWRVSLRSRGKTTIGEIATSMGGGGHPQAAGFSSNKPQKEIIQMIIKHISNQ